MQITDIGKIILQRTFLVDFFMEEIPPTEQEIFDAIDPANQGGKIHHIEKKVYEVTIYYERSS